MGLPGEPNAYAEVLRCGLPPSGWAISEVRRGAEQVWLLAAPDHAVPVGQGWKLHVSAEVTDAVAVLTAVVPVLVAEGVAFKVAGSPRVLAHLNSARAGASQIGKFVTVYPATDDIAVGLADVLDRATASYAGPAVPSDRPLRPGSRISYRYGAFSGQLDLQTPLGDIRSAIRGADGHLLIDARGERYSAPTWLSDPFAAAGVSNPEPLPSPAALGGRFLPIGELHRAPGTVVELGVDLAEDRRCVLKRSRIGVLRDSEGGDAADRLRHEAAVLRHLAGAGGCPEVLALLTVHDEVVLVLDDVEHQTLEERVTIEMRSGSPPDPDLVRAWAASLVAGLLDIHDLGVVHRDLKPGNVILDVVERAHLIDFNSAHLITGAADPGLAPEDRSPDLASPHGGTPGYASPQQLAGSAADPADDVFGFGGVLYFAITGAQPAQTPFAASPLSRPIRQLAPSADAALVAIAERCLTADGERRPDLREVALLLEAHPGPASARTATQDRPPGEGRQRRGTDHLAGHTAPAEMYLALAGELADSLVAATVPTSEPGTLAWLTAHPNGRGLRSRDLGMGTAGALVAATALLEAFPDREGLRAAVRGVAGWLTVAPAPGGDPHAGFYVGESGIAVALLRAGQVLGESHLCEAALARGDRVAAMPFASPDLYNGTAGRLRAHLQLLAVTGDPANRQHADVAASALAEAADREASRVRWTIPPGYADLSGKAFLGYAHGAAGVADVLLDHLVATGDDRHLRLITGVVRLLSDTAVPVLDGAGVSWPAHPELPPAGPFWGHGAAGIGTFLLNLLASGVDAAGGVDVRGLAERAAAAVTVMARPTGPSLCHGLPSGIDMLLDAAITLGEPVHRREAEALGMLLTAFSHERDGHLVWSADNPLLATPDLMIGMGGVATTYLRLALDSPSLFALPT